MERTYFEMYPYTGLTGTVYIPYVENGKWYIQENIPVSFLFFVYLCNISDEEATLLKLTYGA